MMAAVISQVAANRFVLISLFCQITGYTEKAVRHKIEDGIWTEGNQYRRSPDGRIQIDMEGFNKWVAGTHLAVSR
jgi:hypothetical protein